MASNFLGFKDILIFNKSSETLNRCFLNPVSSGIYMDLKQFDGLVFRASFHMLRHTDHTLSLFAVTSSTSVP